MSILTTLFPPANREAAAVAFVRTVGQVITTSGPLGGAGALVVTATGLAHIDIPTILWGAGAVVATALLAGTKSALNILAHGLPDAYTANATAGIPEAIVSNMAGGAPVIGTIDAPVVDPLAEPVTVPAA